MAFTPATGKRGRKAGPARNWAAEVIASPQGKKAVTYQVSDLAAFNEDGSLYTGDATITWPQNYVPVPRNLVNPGADSKKEMGRIRAQVNGAVTQAEAEDISLVLGSDDALDGVTIFTLVR